MIKSLRIRVVNPERYHDLKNTGQNVIFIAWHRTLLLVTGCGGRFGAVSLVSPGRDGDIGAALAARLGVETVRGDSRKKSQQAAMTLARKLRTGSNVALFPDGPLGPNGEIKPGVLKLARLTQCPILPVGADARWKISFQKSWDQFLLPLPFARVAVVFGQPVQIGKHSSRADLDNTAAQLAEQIDHLTALARRRLEPKNWRSES